MIQPAQYIVEFEQGLARIDRNGQQLRIAGTDPAGVIQPMGPEHALSELGDDAGQQGHQLGLGFGYRQRGGFSEPFHRGGEQTVLLHLVVDDAKATFAAGDYLEDAGLGHVALFYARLGSDQPGYRRFADLTAGGDRTDTEHGILPQTASDHVHVAGFEHPQRQPALGEEHRVEREQGQSGSIVHRSVRRHAV